MTFDRALPPRVQHNGRGFRADAGFESFDIVEGKIAEARQQGVEAFLDFCLGGGGHRAERSAMKRLRKREHLVAL